MKKQSFLIYSLLLIGVFLVIASSCKKDDDDNGNTFTDTRDGKIYKWVKIGNQTWMEENLAYLPAVSPSSTGSNADPYYYVYNYQGTNLSEAKATSNYQTYGVLYNWQAAKNVCPTGWHLPTDDEWKTLEMSLGMSQADADGTSDRGTDEGGKLKEKGTVHWVSPNSGASNESGFTALPGGYIYQSAFGDIGYYGQWWTASEGITDGAWTRYLGNDFSRVGRAQYYMREGYSVRCLKD